MIVECVPNFSEGRDANVLSKIAEAIIGTPGAQLLHQTADADHNRSVFTVVGNPEAVSEAAFQAVRAAAILIDLTRHHGVHPRLGAADVVPFVPVRGMTLQQAADLARSFGQRVWNELAIPVYLYEAAALRSEYRRLEQIRKFAPEGLVPDYGRSPHHTAGAVCVGARNFLIAWNINLRTTDLAIAKGIAKEIRESSGGLPALKALGMPLANRRQVQVSMNLVDFERTPLHVAFQAVAERCKVRGVEIAGSELIGLIPQAALDLSRGYDLRWENLTPESVLDHRAGVEF